MNPKPERLNTLETPAGGALLSAAVGGICFGLAGVVTAYGLLDLASFALLGSALHARVWPRTLWLVLVWAAVGYGVGLSWMLVFGIAPWLILAAWHALFLAPFGLLAGWLLRAGRIGPAALALAGLFTLGEWLRGMGDLGVSMHTAAGPLARNLLAVQWAGIFGAGGLSFAVAAIGLLLGLSWRARRPHAGAAAVSALVALLFGALVLLRLAPCPDETVQVAAVQGAAADGFRDPLPDAETEDIYLRLTAAAAKQHNAKLVVWPETSCPGDPVSDETLRQRIATAFKRIGASALVGACVEQPGGDGSSVQRNIVLGFGSDGFLTGAYEKMRLVPFGEYVPLREHLPALIGRWGVPGHDYAPGRDWPVIPFGDVRVGVLVCSESMFPDLAIRRVEQGAQLLVIVSNDSYFGRTPGTEQIARQAILRAVETRRSVVRAAETGYSMMIDPFGRVVRQSKLYERTVVSALLPPMKARTFYTRTAGLWPPVIAMVTALGFAGAVIRRRGL